jgi:FMN-dependent NADH-azoreductase
MTTKILHVECSPLGTNSITRTLGAELLASLKTKSPSADITVRDLAKTPLPHLDGAMIGAFYTPADKQSAEQKSLLKNSEDSIAELFAADTIIVEAPMWNFGIPSALKAWIDHVARAGKTFKYTENGTPVGLLPDGKTMIIVSSRGGIYSEGAASTMDHQESYLKAVFGFLGLKNFEIVRAEGVNMGAEMAEKAKATARTHIETIVKKTA